jgi:hypothetical protein
MEITEEMIESFKDKKTLDKLFKAIGYEGDEDNMKYIKKLREENAERRVQNREYAEEIDKLKTQLSESTTVLSEKEKELTNKLTSIEAEKNQLIEFKTKIFEKKLELIQDEALKEELRKTNSIDLVELTLEKIIKAPQSLGAANQAGEKKDISKLSFQELLSMAESNPEEYNQLMREQISKK